MPFVGTRVGVLSELAGVTSLLYDPVTVVALGDALDVGPNVFIAGSD
jgi:hypothetical protein